MPREGGRYISGACSSPEAWELIVLAPIPSDLIDGRLGRPDRVEDAEGGRSNGNTWPYCKGDRTAV